MYGKSQFFQAGFRLDNNILLLSIWSLIPCYLLSFFTPIVFFCFFAFVSSLIFICDIQTRNTALKSAPIAYAGIARNSFPRPFRIIAAIPQIPCTTNAVINAVGHRPAKVIISTIFKSPSRIFFHFSSRFPNKETAIMGLCHIRRYRSTKIVIYFFISRLLVLIKQSDFRRLGNLC